MYTVRGKRSKRVRPAQGHGKIPRRRGRPLKQPSELKPPRAQLRRQMKELHRLHVQQSQSEKSPTLSPLERLPHELVQQIFFSCFETNLPRASPYIATALSTESTYRSLILFAYFDDDRQSPVEIQNFLPARYRLLGLEDKVRLQRGVLACRWCTLNRVTSCLPSLSRLHMLQAWHRESKRQTEIAALYGSLPIVVHDDHLVTIARLPKLDDEAALQAHFYAKSLLPCGSAHVQRRPELFLPRIITWISEVNQAEPHQLRKVTDSEVSILNARVLPDWLLRGTDWSVEHLRLLQLLRQGFGFLHSDRVVSMSLHCLLQGMENAIKGDHREALLTLLELYTAVFCKADNAGQLRAGPLNPPTQHPLPVSLFHKAALRNSTSSDLLWLLIRASGNSIEQDDALLTGWALRAAQTGDEHAVWLLQHMAGSHHYDLEDGTHLFMQGMAAETARRLDSRLASASMTFAQELKYLPCSESFTPRRLDHQPYG